MFGVINKKSLRVISHNVLQNLVLCQVHRGAGRGRGILEIRKEAGSNSTHTINMLALLVENNSIVNFDYFGAPYFSSNQYTHLLRFYRRTKLSIFLCKNVPI